MNGHPRPVDRIVGAAWGPRATWWASAIVATLVGQGFADGPLELLVIVDGQETQISADCFESESSGLLCSFDGIDVGFTVSGQFSVRNDPQSSCDRVGLFGSLVVSVDQPAASTFLIELRLGATAGLPQVGQAFCSMAGGLACDGTGGQLSSVDAAPLFQATIGDQPVLAAFAGTAVESPGAGGVSLGAASTEGGVGWLVEAEEGLVLRYRFELSGGDRASFSTVLELAPSPAPDLDGDGRVNGADLGLVLANWAQCGVGDLDGNDLVDGADVGLVLAGWTGE